MAQIIEVPNYGSVEFPDETPETEIAGAIRKNVYNLAPLPEMPEYEPQKYSDRLLVSKSNLQTAGEEGAKRLQAFEEMSQAAKAGQIQVSEEDVLKARKDLDLAKDRYSVAEREWAQVQKDPAPLTESFKASVAKGALTTAAAAVENFQPVWQGGPKAFNPEKQKEYDALRTYFKELGPPKEGEDYETTVDRRSIVRQLGQLETPRESTLSGKLAGAAEESAAFYGVNPNAPNTAAQVGRGAGTFAVIAPTLLAGGAGLPLAVAQMGGQTYENAYSQKEKELKANGETDDTLIQEAAETYATGQAVKAVPELAAYMAGGKLASGVVAKILPEASPLLKGLAGTAAATGANVAIGGALRKFSGQDFLPTVEQLTQDALFGVVHGVGEGRKALSEEKTTTGEPNAEQISETGTPDGGVRPRGEVPIVSTQEGGPGVQPSGQGEGLVEQPRGPSPQEIVPAIKVGEDVIRGNPGETHEDVLTRFRKENPDRAVDALMDFNTKGNPNFFLGPDDQPISRAQLQEQFGVSDSQGLAELQQRTPEPVRNLGPGAANIEEAAPQTAIGAKNASVDEQRAARGLPPLMSEARKENQTTWENMEKKVESDPEYPARLVNEIESGEKKSVTDEDQSALLHRMVDLRNQRDMADRRAADEQTYSPEERAAFEEQANGIEAELQRTEEADRKIGTKTARALQIRKIMAKEDFTLAAMERRARKSKGDALTSEERTKIRQQSEEIQATQTKFDERVAKLEEEDAGKAVDQSIRDIETEARKNPEFTPEVRSLADRIIDRLDRAADAALKRLRSKLGHASAGVDPTILADAIIYGSAKIGKGLTKFGKWAAEMVKDLGDGIKPYLEDIWKGADKNIDDQIAGTKTKKPKEVKDAITKQKAVATADEIGAKMKAKGGALPTLRGDIQKLVETLVRSGIKERGALVDAVHEVLKGIDPTITRRQTMDAISGYGDFKPLNKDAVKAEVRDLKGQLQQVAKMEDILAGQPLKKTGVERREPSAEERSLVKQVNELARQHGVKVTDPEVQLKSILGAIETRLKNRIADLKAEIAKGQRAVKMKTPSPSNAKIEALRAELEAVQAQHEAVFGKETKTMTDEQKLRIFKTRTQNRIKELETRLQKKDFAKRPRKELDISKDPEAVRLKAKNERLKKEFDKARFEDEQRKRTTLRKGIDVVKETLAASRSLITSADVSAPLRQGGFLLIGDLPFHPLRVAKQLGTMFHQLVSEKGFQRAQAAIGLRPNADLYVASKLYFSDMDGKLSAREENMRSTLAERIPVVGHIVRASNRAYSGFLNRQRADAFDAMVEARGGKGAVTPEGAKLLADAVNTLTGRGSIGATNEGAANFLARYLFSPRFLASRFQTVLGKPIFGAIGKGSSVADRAVVARQYAKFAVGLAAIYGLAQLAGGKVEKDPRSSDFGKIRLGNTRVDPLAGLSQVTVLMARTATGKTKSQGELKPVSADTYYQFARSKLAPVPGALLDLRTGKNVVGEKTTLPSVAQSLTVPLSYQDAGKIYKAHGPMAGTVLTILNLLGAGTQHYKPR